MGSAFSTGTAQAAQESSLPISLPKHKALREWRSCLDIEINVGKTSEGLNTKSKQAVNVLLAFICFVS